MTYSAPPAFMMINGNHQCPQGSLACNFFGQDLGTNSYRLLINDLGRSQFTLSVNTGDFTDSFVTQPTSYSSTTVVGESGTNGVPPPGTNFWLKFRYYPDSSKIGTLNQGEVAFFEGCNYEGQGAVVTNDFEPWKYRVDGSGLTNPFYSIRLSNNTTVQVSLNDGNGNVGQAFFVVNDTPCLPQVLDDANLVYPLDKSIDGTGTE